MEKILRIIKNDETFEYYFRKYGSVYSITIPETKRLFGGDVADKLKKLPKRNKYYNLVLLSDEELNKLERKSKQ